MNIKELTILGGGPAGLSVGYYAKKKGMFFKIYEASARVGGNCQTLKAGDFLFDSGAHRFHDKDKEATREIKTLLGDELKLINIPSQIYFKGKYIDFPLSPLNLLKELGIKEFALSAFQILISKIAPGKINSFKDLVLNEYGKKIAADFLLNYSEKLWGLPAEKLSPLVAGIRLKGLNLKTFLVESILGSKAKTTHLDGAFYYPENGIGSIFEKMADFCHHENIKKNSKISKILHDDGIIKAIELNNKQTVEVSEVINSLPLNLFIKLLYPQPPPKIIALSEDLNFRNIVLVAVFLNKEKVSDNGSLYFPEKIYSFNRIYEPRNRSIKMTPAGKTSLIIEIPCQTESEIWAGSNEDTTAGILDQLTGLNLFTKEEIIGSAVYKIKNAYPVLETGYEKKVEILANYLTRFKNLRTTGRSGKFAYTHIHDMMRSGKEIIDSFD